MRGVHGPSLRDPITPSYVRGPDEPAVRPKIIIDTSRGDAATFDPYPVGPASQLRQRKVILKFRGPERDRRLDDRLEGRPIRSGKGPGGRAVGMERPTQQAAGRAPRSGHDMCWLCARRSSAICSRASCCLRINSILRRFVQGARPTHDRPKTALCATSSPPKLQVGRRARNAHRRPSTAALAL